MSSGAHVALDRLAGMAEAAGKVSAAEIAAMKALVEAALATPTVETGRVYGWALETMFDDEVVQVALQRDPEAIARLEATDAYRDGHLRIVPLYATPSLAGETEEALERIAAVAEEFDQHGGSPSYMLGQCGTIASEALAALRTDPHEGPMHGGGE